MDKETCLKNIGKLAEAIENTSIFNLLLFAITQNKKKTYFPVSEIQVGFND